MKKKSKLERLTPIVLGTCLLTFVAACGSDDDDSSSSTPQQQQQQQEGQYQVVFTPVNPNVAPTITGTGDFSLAGDNFEAKINVVGAPLASHPQFVFTGGACPSATSDTNGDGYVDIVEATTVAGNPFLPLDSDLRDQASGGVFPLGMNYNYDESTSYQTMLADLHLPDTDTADLLAKLGATEDLNLEGRVVMVHGIASSTTVPGTVVGAGGLSPQQTLPIACGVVARVSTGTTTGTTTGDTGTTTGTTTGDTGTSTGTTTGDTGTSTGTTTGTTTGDTGTTTGDTGTTTGTTGTTTGTTGTTTGTTGTTTGTTGTTTGTTGTTTGTTGTGTTTGTTATTTGTTTGM
jgi:hypothetical protein